MHKKISALLAAWPQHHYLSKPGGGGGWLGGVAYKDRARPPPPPRGQHTLTFRWLRRRGGQEIGLWGEGRRGSKGREGGIFPIS